MKIYLFTFLMFCTAVCYAQIFPGTYRFKSNDLSVSRTITFSEKNFIEEIVGDLGSKIGNGTYQIKNNKLTLNHHTFLNQDTSSYEMITSNKSNSSSMINLKVFDADKIPMVASFGCRDFKNNPIIFTNTNGNGLGNMTIYNNSSIGYFTIDYIGYFRISIPIKTLLGKMVNITAYLRPQTKTYIDPQTIKYKISNINNKKLILNDNLNTLVFEKID